MDYKAEPWEELDDSQTFLQSMIISLKQWGIHKCVAWVNVLQVHFPDKKMENKNPEEKNLEILHCWLIKHYDHMHLLQLNTALRSWLNLYLVYTLYNNFFQG